MSNIGKQPVQIPDNVTIEVTKSSVAVKGNLGELVATDLTFEYFSPKGILFNFRPILIFLFKQSRQKLVVLYIFI